MTAHRPQSEAMSDISQSSEGTEASAASQQQRLKAAIDALKEQHSILVDAMRDGGRPLSPTFGGPAMAPMAESPELGSPASPVLSERHARRVSSASGMSIWFDAPEPEGALEFVMDHLPANGSGSRLLDLPEADEGEAASDAGADTDDESPARTPAPSVVITPADDEKPRAKPGASPTQSQRSLPRLPKPPTVKRRTQLPSGPVADEGSLFTVLKKNIGKVRQDEVTTLVLALTWVHHRTCPRSRCLSVSTNH
jgi:hypothetical protein